MLGQHVLVAQAGSLFFGTTTTNATTGYVEIPIIWTGNSVASANATAVRIDLFVSGSSLCIDAAATQNSVNTATFSPSDVSISGSMISLYKLSPTLIANYTPLITLYVRVEPSSFVDISVGSTHVILTTSGPKTIALPTTNPISEQMRPPYQISGQVRKPPMPDGDAPPECHGGSIIGIPNVDFLFTVPAAPLCFPDPRGTAFSEYSSNGYYTSDVPMLYAYNIEPVKHEDPDPDVTDDDTDCGCGITDDDIIQGRKFILSIIDDAPSLQQVIAADINQSGTVTTYDLVLMSNCMNGIDNANAAVKPWRFVTKTDYDYYNVHPINPVVLPVLASSITTAAIAADLPNQNFYGIKLGDIVEQDCTECGDQDLFAPPNEDRGVVSAKDLFFEDVALEAGKEYLVPVSGSRTSGLAEFSVELMFDPAYFDLLGIEHGVLSDNYANHKVHREGAANVLKYIWFSMRPGGENLEDRAPLFYLRIRAKKGAATLRGLLWQRWSARYNNLFFANGAEKAKWGLRSTAPASSGFLARLTGANPAQSSTEVTVYMPQAAEVFISIVDMNGRPAAYQKVTAAAGWNNISVNNLPADPGVYALHIRSEFGQESIRFVKQ